MPRRRRPVALVPDVGLVVRDNGGGALKFFTTPDALAMMASMSAARVAWLVAVVRGIVHRKQGAVEAPL